MIMLGIDPGTRSAGYAIIEKGGGITTLHHYGVITLSADLPLFTRVGLFAERVDNIIEQWGVTDLALETPFLGKNAQNFLKLGYLRGVLYSSVHRKSLGLHEYAPSQVKQAIAGSGSADKAVVARVVRRLFPGFSCDGPADISDAIAIALCAAWRFQQTFKQT